MDSPSFDFDTGKLDEFIRLCFTPREKGVVLKRYIKEEYINYKAGASSDYPTGKQLFAYLEARDDLIYDPKLGLLEHIIKSPYDITEVKSVEAGLLEQQKQVLLAKMRKMNLEAKARDDTKEIELKKLELEMIRVKMEDKRLTDRLELDRKKAISNKKLKEEELKIAREKIAEESKQRQLDRELLAQENNKILNLRPDFSQYNKYLDLEIFGNRGTHYATADSVKRIIAAGIFTHDIPKEMREIDICKKVDMVAKAESVKSVVYDPNGSQMSIDLIPLRNVCRVMRAAFDNIDKDDLTEIKDYTWITTNIDRVNQIESIYRSYNVQTIAANVTYRDLERRCFTYNGGMHDKPMYLKPKNMYEKLDEGYIRCYTCGVVGLMKSRDMDRAHNIPKSKGGSWEPRNIYLCCPDCNKGMSNALTVEEYAQIKMQDMYEQLSKQFPWMV